MSLYPDWADHTRMFFCRECPGPSPVPAYVGFFVGCEDGQVTRVECENGHAVDLEDSDELFYWQTFANARDRIESAFAEERARS